MSVVSMCRVVWVRGRERGEGLAGYQPGVYVPLKALFIVLISSRLHDYSCKCKKQTFF